MRYRTIVQYIEETGEIRFDTCGDDDEEGIWEAIESWSDPEQDDAIENVINTLNPQGYFLVEVEM